MGEALVVVFYSAFLAGVYYCVMKRLVMALCILVWGVMMVAALAPLLRAG